MIQQISLPSSNRRTHHPHDTDGVFTVEHRLGHTSTGEHMEVGDYIWVDPKTGKEIRESSQWGTHFDTPYHFYEKGERGIPTSEISGPALVVDIREELSVWSDGYAITKVVIENWMKAHGSEKKENEWERMLLRVLTDKDAGSTEPIWQFPYFDSAETVEVLLGYANKQTGDRTVKIICTESPSVDYRDCGGLLIPDTHGKGGAHGAFYRHGVSIGENWDFRNLGNMTHGILYVSFDATKSASDAMKVYTAVFEIDIL